MHFVNFSTQHSSYSILVSHNSYIIFCVSLEEVGPEDDSVSSEDTKEGIDEKEDTTILLFVEDDSLMELLSCIDELSFIEDDSLIEDEAAIELLSSVEDDSLRELSLVEDNSTTSLLFWEIADSSVPLSSVPLPSVSEEVGVVLSPPEGFPPPPVVDDISEARESSKDDISSDGSPSEDKSREDIFSIEDEADGHNSYIIFSEDELLL